MTDAIRYEKGQDNIVVLTMDMPGQSANTMNAAYREAMAATLTRLEAEKDEIAGLVEKALQEGHDGTKSRRKPSPPR